MIGVSQYFRTWDRTDIPSNTTEEKFQNTLLNSPWVMEYRTNQHVATRNTLAAQGLPYTLVTYEGGPDVPTGGAQGGNGGLKWAGQLHVRRPR